MEVLVVRHSGLQGKLGNYWLRVLKLQNIDTFLRFGTPAWLL
jgi:hypothetical protein